VIRIVLRSPKHQHRTTRDEDRPNNQPYSNQEYQFVKIISLLFHSHIPLPLHYPGSRSPRPTIAYPGQGLSHALTHSPDEIGSSSLSKSAEHHYDAQ